MKQSKKERGQNGRPREFDHGTILHLSLSDVKPSPENDELYGVLSDKDPEVLELARSIVVKGIMEPLVITADFFILSGHRRYFAAGLAGEDTVPCRIDASIRRSDLSKDQYLVHLREFNRHRVKSLDVVAREQLLDLDPDEPYRELQEHRRRKARVRADTIEITGETRRAKISKAKRPFLDAILRIIDERKKYLPLTDRQIHYALLTDPPLVHASKPGSRYENTPKFYKATCDLIARARIEGEISWDTIHDPTRPVTIWKVFKSTGPFLQGELNELLKGYYRNLQQSQPDHIEIVGEKNTIESIISPVAADYCIPLTIGRGYSSLSPRHEMAKRFRESGKDKLIIIFLSDFDPEGEDIAHSFARSMRDDFKIENIVPIKAALTAEQVQSLKLPPQMKAKKGSSRRKKFVGRHGDDVFELEAIPPDQLQQILRETIDKVLDLAAFNAEIDKEKKDALHLKALRSRIKQNLGDIVPGGG